ncbi:major facilitator superfamily domain-containing protein [Kockovaella imperatae]|uniref:Major facilitator superfamily domain-containing protein n=1 Tax=Kockovaella imperatae TaxID=4999 RepID=A0A1Y1URB0_9TREE|nr:major facilitator superfamily domain-containing protein [Kockovaella imperatae]ORX40509.1 major facilitator superfamily domain-containing protein [Kockovaella imperatae]
MSASSESTAADENRIPDEQLQHAAHNNDQDVEKQPPAPKHGMPTFPEGGLFAWMAVAGAWLAIFTTFGYANTFGVFQDYYQFKGYPNQPATNISWVGSVQLFFQFALGAVAGPLYDKGYFRHLMVVGTVIYVVCLMMTSLCKEFWQTVLAQGIGVGIGIGLIYLPALSILSQFFMKRRATAIGIAVTGSSVGGICLPIMLNNLIEQHGFRKAVQYTGYLILGCLVLSIALMHPRIPPNPNPPKKPSPKELLKDIPYVFCCLGAFSVALGLFFPFFYLQVFAQVHGLSHNLVFYTLAIVNGASVFGRVVPNLVADKIGSLNLMTAGCFASGIIAYSIFGAGTPGGLIAVAILYGFFSGAYVSLISPALIAFANNHTEIGLRVGFGFMAVSLAALSGTPITGALLDRYGFYAPIIWSGTTITAGGVLFCYSNLRFRQKKGTWKV